MVFVGCPAALGFSEARRTQILLDVPVESLNFTFTPVTMEGLFSIGAELTVLTHCHYLRSGRSRTALTDLDWVLRL